VDERLNDVGDATLTPHNGQIAQAPEKRPMTRPFIANSNPSTADHSSSGYDAKSRFLCGHEQATQFFVGCVYAKVVIVLVLVANLGCAESYSDLAPDAGVKIEDVLDVRSVDSGLIVQYRTRTSIRASVIAVLITGRIRYTVAK